MSDIVHELRGLAIGMAPASLARNTVTNAADEIERLRDILVQANNTWRHSFKDEVSAAVERLFKKLSTNQTDPFNRKGAA